MLLRIYRFGANMVSLFAVGAYQRLPRRLSVGRSAYGCTSKVESGVAMRRLCPDRLAYDNIYKELPESWIHLLELDPGTTQPINCSLKPILLSDAVGHNFEALSYEWGRNNKDYLRVIELHGSGFFITKSLHGALLELRRPDTPRWLWVDALCINQSDQSEKAVQLKLMARIYRSAEEVAAWLGPLTRTLEPVTKLLKAAELQNEIDRLGILLDIGRSEHFDALKALMDCTYWYRAWVVQEIVSARKLRVYVGHVSCAYESLQWVLNTIPTIANSSCSPDGPSTFSLSPPAFPKRIIRQEDLDQGSISMDLYLGSLIDRQCSESQDHVFAFYALFPQQLREHISVDYGLDADIVLLQAFAGIVEFSRSLEFLGLRSRQERPCGPKQAWQRKTPSWCPYVGVSFKDESIASLQDFATSPLMKGEPSIDNATSVLHAFGFAIGHISEFLEPYVGSDFETEGMIFDEQTAESMIRHRKQWLKRGLLLPKCGDACNSSRASSIVTESGRVSPKTLQMAQCYWKHTRGKSLCTVKINARNDAPELCLVALTPATARIGDRICLIEGCTSAIVLRDGEKSREKEKCYSVIGEAYVEGAGKLAFDQKLQHFLLK